MKPFRRGVAMHLNDCNLSCFSVGLKLIGRFQDGNRNKQAFGYSLKHTESILSLSKRIRGRGRDERVFTSL